MSTHIETTPGTRGGRPRISGTRITVDDVVLLHLRLGRSVEEVAGDYDLPLAGVHAALTYYYDHKAEIDGSIDEDRAFSEAFRKSNPSLLREKLSTLTRG